MKNPYLENKEKIEEHYSIINSLYAEKKPIEDAIGEQYKIIGELKKCTHYDKDGNWAVERTGQDPGSGKTEKACRICGIDP